MNVSISTDPARIDLDAVWAMVRESYWSPGVRREIVARAIANSLVVGAYDADTGRQVGFARAVTDRATFAWLCDVIVAPDARRRGIATRMVRALMDHPDTQSLRRWCLATRDAHGVYAPLGFTPVDAAGWMERKGIPAAWSDPPAAS